MKCLKMIMKHLFRALVVVLLFGIIWVFCFIDLRAFVNTTVLLVLPALKPNLDFLAQLLSDYGTLLLAFFLLSFFVYILITFKPSLKVSEFSFAGITFQLRKPNIKKRVAMFLNTRRSICYYLEGYDNLFDVMKSWYEILTFLRTLLNEQATTMTPTPASSVPSASSASSSSPTPTLGTLTLSDSVAPETIETPETPTSSSTVAASSTVVASAQEAPETATQSVTVSTGNTGNTRNTRNTRNTGNTREMSSAGTRCSTEGRTGNTGVLGDIEACEGLFVELNAFLTKYQSDYRRYYTCMTEKSETAPAASTTPTAFTNRTEPTEPTEHTEHTGHTEAVEGTEPTVAESTGNAEVVESEAGRQCSFISFYEIQKRYPKYGQIFEDIYKLNQEMRGVYGPYFGVNFRKWEKVVNRITANGATQSGTVAM